MNAKLSRAFLLVVLAAVYFAAGRLGLSMARLHASVSPVWPATGIALAAMLLYGRRLWPAIFAGAFLVNASGPAADSPLGLNMLQAAGIAVGNTLEALAGAWLVERFVQGRHVLERVSGIFYFAVLAGVLSTAISASIGTFTLFSCGLLEGNAYAEVWLTWWMGDMVSAIVVTPLLLIWASKPWRNLDRGQWLEAGTMALAVLLASQAIFGLLFSPDEHYPLAFLLIPLLVWAALRFEARGVVSVVFVVSCFAIAGTLRGFGPFAVSDQNSSLLLLQAFMCVVTIASLILATAVSERKRAEAELRSEKERLQRSEEEIRRLNTGLEQRVQDRTAQLEATNRELEAFCYSVSHDLRAPLRTIHGFSEVLVEQYGAQLDQRGRDYLRRMTDAGTQMDRLIEDLLKLSRVSRGTFTAQKVNLSSLVEEITAELKQGEPAREVEVTIAPDLLAQGDERLVRLALDNLLRNAWKFTGKRVRARIEFGRMNGDGSAFFVRDNGAGFDMTYAGKLFGVFQRLHSPGEFPGSGVGLAIVQRVINRHGGKVWAESQVDSGATFYFTLPANSPAS